MTPKFKKRLFQVGSFVLAGGLLYLALRGVDFARVGEDLKGANYWWLIPIALATMVSHWLRAIRWRLFLESLPDDGRPVSTGGAFSAILIGYMVNYAAPRLGEVVRTANVATRYNRPFSSVLGTVAIERILDVIVLLLAFLTLPFVFAGRMDAVAELMSPAREWIGQLPLGLLAGVGVLVAILGFFVYRRYPLLEMANGDTRVGRIVGSFRDGVLALVRTPKKGVVVYTTIGIWFSYALMAYIPFLLFGFEDLYGISLLDSWGIMLIGALGIVVPSPGGVGSFHYITIQTLVLLFAFAPEAAASYAILSHAGQLVLYVVAGFAAIVIQGSGFKGLATPDS